MVQNIDGLSYNLLKNSLNATAERGRVIAQNLANLNTKGYKAKRIAFEGKISSLLNNESIPLRVTNEKHISVNSSVTEIKPEVYTDKTTSMRIDGNNVDPDNETTNLAANTIMYNTLITQANSRLAMRRYVISEGRR